MKTTAGNIKFRFTIMGGWGLYFTELRTYRNKLLYYHGDLYPSPDTFTKKAYARSENRYFLQHAETLVVDQALLYNAFMSCLSWKSIDKTVFTSDNTNWELTLQLDNNQYLFDHDMPTDDFVELTDRLEVIIQRVLIADRHMYY